MRRRLSALGSSPLARGLLILPWDGRVGERIIPARAGFTNRATPLGSGCTDHPRSRGVYPVRGGANSCLRGSSPLARGLHGFRCAPPVRGGIIPARAGFTPCSPSRSPTHPDHPRSRGVYMDPGSPGSTDPRIIPARAGFTPSWPATLTPPPDHPRSRGVYSSRARRPLAS